MDEANSSTPSDGYVSGATREVEVVANGKTLLWEAVQPPAKSFSASFAVPAGSDSFVVTLRSEFGSALSIGTTTQKMASGKTTPLVVTYDAIVDRGTLAASNPPVGKPTTVQVTFRATDPAAQPIKTGKYLTPIQLHFSDPTGHMELKGTSRFYQAGQAISVSYDGKLMTAPAKLSTSYDDFGEGLTLVGNAYKQFSVRSGVSSIAAGPDDTLLFNTCQGRRCEIGMVDTSGKVRIIGAQPFVDQIVYAPDGAIWYTENAIPGFVGRMSLSGAVRRYSAPSSNSGSYAIAIGKDKSVWFADDDGIARVTPSGEINQHNVPFLSWPGRSTTLVVASDGRFYLDDSPNDVCTVSATGTSASCFGQEDAVRVGAGTQAALFPPLTPYKAGVFLRASLRMGYSDIALLSPNGTLQSVGSPRHDYVVPRGVGRNGEIFGFSPPQGVGSLAGVAIQKFANNQLTNVTYPIPDASTLDNVSVVVTRDNVWLATAATIYCFPYAQLKL